MIPALMGDWVLPFVIGAIALLMLASLVLTAVALRLRLQNARRAREWERLEALWTPVFLDVLAEVRKPDELHALIEPTDQKAFIGFLSRFSERVRGTEWAVLRELAQPYLPKVAGAAKGRDPERRARAIQTLGELGMPEYEDTVVAALDDESPLVAMVSARSLFRPGNEVHFKEVLDHVSRFSLWSSRFLTAMFASGGPEVTPMLREVLADPLRSNAERVAALDALRVLHDTASADRAILLLGESVDRELRLSALRLLEVLGRKSHAAAVRSLLASEDSTVRRAAAGTLGALGDPTDAGALAELLNDPSPWVRVGAADALSSLGARDELLKAATQEGPGGQVAREVVGG